MDDGRELRSFDTRVQWREWLSGHHGSEREAWLVLYKKGRSESALSLEEAVEEAICFGWIDGKLRSMDDDRYSLRFTPRRAGSVWSVSNIRRVERLTTAGLMTAAGLASVAQAKACGQWQAAIERERTDVIPEDLLRALRGRKGAAARYRNLRTSRRKQLLYWLASAKTVATREKRIAAIVDETAPGT
jgi:uncharacterized protein YdeI (YjbR/CyaY-like superfamily)